MHPPPPPCVHPKRFPCLRSKRFRVYWHQAHMFPTCGLGAGTHGDVLNLHTESVFERVHGFFFSRFFTVLQHTKHTPRPPTTPRPQRHHHHNDTHHITQHGDRNRERQRKRDKTRQEKTRQDKKAREERREEIKKKREEEERRRREKEERENEQRQTIFSGMSVSARIIFTPNSGECPAAPELFSPNVRDVRQHWN